MIRNGSIRATLDQLSFLFSGYCFSVDQAQCLGAKQTAVPNVLFNRCPNFVSDHLTAAFWLMRRKTVMVFNAQTSCVTSHLKNDVLCLVVSKFSLVDPAMKPRLLTLTGKTFQDHPRLGRDDRSIRGGI